jgi:predicted DNA-binding transcriptional regulator YafY
MQNESVLYNVDAIQRALNSKLKISFLYYDYDFSKKKVARKEGERYIVNPIGLTYTDEFYYLVTYTEKYDNFTNYRVDRMMKLDILDEPAVRAPGPGKFDMAEYCRHSFGMFGGEDIRVRLVFHRLLMNAMVDRFGKDVRVEQIDDDHARAYVAISTSEPFFGWITQFGDFITIESPDSLREEYAEFLENILECY